MRKIALTGLASLLLVLPYSCFCQEADTFTKLPAADTIPLRINWSTPPLKKEFPYKQLIIPAVMITYGITSLGAQPLQHINYKVKEEVYTERTNKAKITVDNFLLYAPGVAVYALNAAGVKGKNNFRDRTIIYAMSELIQSAIVFPVKSLVAENRPDESNRLSFPSGHTACAFASAEFMRQEYKDVSPWYGVAGYAAAAGTGFLRMYNNKHWFSDVVAGAGIGIMSTKLAYWIYPSVKKAFFKDKPVSTVVVPVYHDGALGLGMVHHF